MYIIVKNLHPDTPNWSGKEFSEAPAKIYRSLESVFDDLLAYWEARAGRINIIHLSEEKKDKLLEAEEIRW